MSDEAPKTSHIEHTITYLTKKIESDLEQYKSVPPPILGHYFGCYAELAENIFLGPVHPLEAVTLRQKVHYVQRFIEYLKNGQDDRIIYIFFLYSDTYKKDEVIKERDPSFLELQLAMEEIWKHQREVDIVLDALGQQEADEIKAFKIPFSCFKSCLEEISTQDATTNEITVFIAPDGMSGEIIINTLCDERKIKCFPLNLQENSELMKQVFSDGGMNSDHKLLKFLAEKILDDILNESDVKELADSEEMNSLTAELLKYPFNDTVRSLVKKNQSRYKEKFLTVLKENTITAEYRNFYLFILMSIKPYLDDNASKDKEDLKHILEKKFNEDIKPEDKIYFVYRLLDIIDLLDDNSEEIKINQFIKFIKDNWETLKEEFKIIHSNSPKLAIDVILERLQKTEFPLEKKWIYLFELNSILKPKQLREIIRKIEKDENYKKLLDCKHFKSVFEWLKEQNERSEEK